MLENVFHFPTLPPPLTEPIEPAAILREFEDATFFAQEGADIEDVRLTTSIRRAGYSSLSIFEARSVATFGSFGLPEELMRGIYSAMGFDRPSEIQALSIPLICKDPFYSLIAQAHNGSGKTCCFALCILSRLDYNLHSPQAVVFVPTRELAVQNEAVIKKMGTFTQVTVVSTRSADEVNQQRSAITDMVVVGTIGTMQRWIQTKKLPFKDLKVVVFDEADIMLEREAFGDHSLLVMMLIESEARIQTQILFFSATYNDRVRDFAEILFNTFERRVSQKIYVPKEDLSLDTIWHANVKCDGLHDKIRIVKDRILPACVTRERWAVTAISGEMEHADRDRVVTEFKNSTTSILVSTDVLARGFDCFDVNTVINFDIPVHHETFEPGYETYLHRVGRSGRFRRHGAAFNLTDVYRRDGEDIQKMEAIAQYFDREIPFLNVDDDQALKKFLKKAALIE